MVTDEMLRDATIEAELFFLGSLPCSNEKPHIFSEKFEKKMNRLIRRVTHPIRYNILRTAAAILLAILTLFGSIFALSPEVRANVISWVKSTFFEFFQYSSDGSAEHIEYEYHFETIPDGFSELNVIDSKDGKTYLYANDTGNILQFTYAHGGRADNFFVKTETYTHITDEVGGYPADIYITSVENEANVIIWRDLETDTLLCINAKLKIDQLIAFAEMITSAEK